MADSTHLGPGRPRPRALLRTLVGQALRRNRLEQQRTLAEVARAACVSVPYLSEVERGRKELSSELLAAICNALDLQLADLLGEVRFEITRAQLADLTVTGRAVGSRSITSLTSIQAEPMAPPNLPGQVSMVAA
jgi:transcriptional regulator with XRE-family HTH domain